MFSDVLDQMRKNRLFLAGVDQNLANDEWKPFKICYFQQRAAARLDQMPILDDGQQAAPLSEYLDI